jgi:hypothetical protein
MLDEACQLTLPNTAENISHPNNVLLNHSRTGRVKRKLFSRANRRAKPNLTSKGSASVGGGKCAYKGSRNVFSESPASFIIFFSNHHGNSPECTATQLYKGHRMPQRDMASFLPLEFEACSLKCIDNFFCRDIR